ELRLEGPAAAALAGVDVTAAASALHEHNVKDGAGLVAIASAAPLGEGEVATLRFPATGETWDAPRLAWARANATALTPAPAPPSSIPAVSFMAVPAPNPAMTRATLRLGLARDEAS